MTLTVAIDSENISSEVRRLFEEDANWAFQGYTALCTKFDLPVATVHMILTDDLEGAVRLRTGDLEYSATRGPVRVAAKCLYEERRVQDQTLNVIVDSWSWGKSQDAYDRLRALSVVNHELMHPVLDQIWIRAGILDDTKEAARLGRVLSDEYWADMLASAVLEAFKVSVTISMSDGSSGEVPPSLLLMPGYLDAMQTFLGDAHPQWPDTVQAYREGAIDLDTMRYRLASSFGECAILLAHTQSFMDGAQETPDNRRSVFSIDTLGCLPAARLYVAEPWQELWECIQSAPLGQGREELWQYYSRLTEATDQFFRRMWRPLGVEITSFPNGGAYFHVSEPKR